MKEENFEELIVRLEDITNKLEKDNLNLKELIELFEEGMKISEKCNNVLENAEKKISVLIKDGDEIKEEKFENEN